MKMPPARSQMLGRERMEAPAGSGNPITPPMMPMSALFPLFGDEARPVSVGFGEIAFGVGVEVVADAFAVLQQ